MVVISCYLCRKHKFPLLFNFMVGFTKIGGGPKSNIGFLLSGENSGISRDSGILENYVITINCSPRERSHGYS